MTDKRLTRVFKSLCEIAVVNFIMATKRSDSKPYLIFSLYDPETVFTSKFEKSLKFQLPSSKCSGLATLHRV